jgi:TP901 family phage tail tape measure protein
VTTAVESRSVIVRLQAEVSQYRNDIRAAGKDTTAAFTSAKVAAKEVGAQSTASQKAMRDVGTAAATSTKRTADASRTATQSAKKDAADLEKAQTRIVAAGALTLGAILKTAADFDQAMSSVQAATHESADNMELLRTAAIDAGARTTFSATEAAGAIENLAKAGVDTADILSGGLDGALSLAAAGTLQVADAAEFVATALSQFKLKGDQATHVADLLAAGAGKAQGEVSDMALALDYAGVPAANLGVSIEQTAGTIALLSKNGVIGEKAGTSLRGMLASLTSPSKIAAQEMKNLGLRVFDAHGNFVGLDGVAGQLQTRLGKLTQEERANALGKIFGNEQLQAANILYREGAKGVREWTAQVNDAGYAADTAAIKQDNLKGDVEKLGGAFSSLFISAGEGAQGPLRGLTQELTSLVDTIDGLPDPVKAAGVVLIAAGTAAAGLSLAAAKIGPPFLQARTAVTSFARTAVTDLANVARYGRLATESSARLGASFRTLGKGALVLGGLALASSGLDEKLGLTNTTMFATLGLIAGPWGAAVGAGAGLLVDFAHAGDASERALKGLDDELTKNQGNLVIQQEAIDKTRAHFEELQKDFYNDSVGATLRHALSPDFWNEAASSVGKGTSAYQDQLDQVNKLAEGNGQLQESLFYIGSQLGQDFGSGNPQLEDLTAVATRAKPALDALGISLEDLSSASLSTEGRASIGRQIIAWMQYSDSAEGRTDALATSVSGMGNKMQTTADKADALGKALDALLSPNLDLSEATDKWTTALRHLTDDLAKHGRSLKGNSDAAIANRAAIRDRITQLAGMLKAEADAGASSTELAKTLRGQKQALIDAGVAAGLSKSELKNYLAEMGLTPALVQTVIEAVGVDKARAGVRGLKADIDALHDKHVTISAEVHRTRLLEQTGPAVAMGGQVFGPGTTTSDDIPARLSNREFVVRAAAVDHYGADFFHRANSMRLAEGGLATTSGVRRYEGGNFRQVPTTHATRSDVRMQLGAGPVAFTITNWETGEGYFRGLAVSEIDADAAYQAGLGRMHR